MLVCPQVCGSVEFGPTNPTSRQLDNQKAIGVVFIVIFRLWFNYRIYCGLLTGINSEEISQMILNGVFFCVCANSLNRINSINSSTCLWKAYGKGGGGGGLCKEQFPKKMQQKKMLRGGKRRKMEEVIGVIGLFGFDLIFFFLMISKFFPPPPEVFGVKCFASVWNEEWSRVFEKCQSTSLQMDSSLVGWHSPWHEEEGAETG